MDEIINYVAGDYKEWALSLSVKDIGDILNKFRTTELTYNLHTLNLQAHELKQEPELKQAAVQGLIGETKFENIVNQHLSVDYELINVSKQKNCGDFIIKWESTKTNQVYKILIDVKNYNKGKVPTLEINKFHRDININNVHGGILLSLNSGITGISKIIEIKKINTDRGKINIIFIQSNTPTTIAELIKLLFHIIEISDISRHDLFKADELLYYINQLSDNVQLITECRDILQSSKTSIEKTMNDIMVKLIACEYNLASKINQINANITNLSIIKHVNIDDDNDANIDNIDNVNIDEAKLINNVNIDEAKLIDDVKNIRNAFSNMISDEIESILYTVYKLGWTSYNIDTKKNTLNLICDIHTVVVKFYKAHINMTFPYISDMMYENISKLVAMKKVTRTLNNITLKMNVDTLPYIRIIHTHMVKK